MTQPSDPRAIPGPRDGSAEPHGTVVPVPPRLTKAVIRNFRLLRRTELSFTDKVTLCVGRNNTGKTSLAKLFEFFVARKKAALRIEDFSADCYEEFLAAHRLFASGEAEQARDTVPAVTLTLHISYDKDCGQYGPLAPFVVDLDPDCSEVVIRFAFGLGDGALKEFFGGVPVGPDATATLEQLGRGIPKHFEMSVMAVDPTDEANVRPVDLADVRTLVRVDFVEAQRGLDDESDGHAAPIGAVFEQLLTAAEKSQNATWLEELAANIDRTLVDTSGSLDSSLQKVRERVAPTLKAFGYPGLANQEFVTAARLDSKRLLRNFARIHYPGVAGVRFPESYNGLGTRNLVMILLRLFTCYRDHTATSPESGIHLVFLEEPEAHLHPQMQEAFIQRLTYSVNLFPRIDAQMRATMPGQKGAVEESSTAIDSSPRWNAQFVVTTHSAHVANRGHFSDIRYFRKEEDTVESGSEPGPARTVIKDLSQVTGDERFLRKYLTLTRADLYFADKAILVEGASERIFVPAAEEELAARRPGETPQHQYVTLMEVGGAHAHRFYPLLKVLGIPALIITDLDPVDDREPKIRKCLVSESGRTSNQSIRAWSPEMADITVAELLQRAETDPPIAGGSMCLAYQVPEEPGGPCGRTFEDAFALANRARFGISTGAAPAEELEQQARSSVETRRSKVDFALDHVLGDHDWQVPKYIRRGLEWLMAQDGAATKADVQ
ncbi:ATP-dependent endonuclease [Streptomyces sp. Ncost-T10-10d]|uniref:ATP-dependent nuclease n=1 Tax=Streptomyces sp. Ncost-T10-10d TaxID=1839774 RepID=UPI00081ED8B1|nr:AAA family ATPase [Streptomyces sp. Ncost-T10-10d]SCF73364.1 Predicted ATP-dependent endonuclease of the OLD family, contains P-loop ATPase and TOPRIM domains [Streptomyces sp. Ncost-T10-10d]